MKRTVKNIDDFEELSKEELLKALDEIKIIPISKYFEKYMNGNK